MEVKIRYLSNEIAKYFGSSKKIETIRFSTAVKYADILSLLKKKLRRYGKMNERLLDTFVFICGGRALLNLGEEALNSDCEVLIGYADTGG